MKQVASFPQCRQGSWDRWSPQPAEDIDRLLQGLSFKPTRAALLLQGNYYPAAKLLGMEVPTMSTSGEVQIQEGASASFQWGSIDGRSTDYLSLEFDFEPKVLRDLVDRLSQVMTIERRSDLQVFLSAPCT